MENKFECGNEAFLRVGVCAVLNEEIIYDYDVCYLDHYTGGMKHISVIEEQLATADEIADEPGIDWQAKYNEYNEKAEAKIRELTTRLNGMAESLREAQAKAVSLNASLKEVGTTNADLVIKNAVLTKTNSELEEKLSSGKGDVEYWRTKYMNMKKSRNEYKRAADHLKEERDRADDELALTRIMNVALAEKIERLQNG